MKRALPRLFVLLAVATMAGCAGMARLDALTGDVAAEDESRLVILAVDNGDPAPPPRPASTRPSYLGAAYAASDAARATLRAVAQEYGLREVTAWPIAVLKLHCAVLRIPDGGRREELLARLAQDRRLRLAQPMNGFTPRTDYNDPYLNLQRGFRSIDAADAQQWSRGEDIRVAIVDTGLDARHPDFGGRVVVQRNFVDRDAARFAQDRHGTAVAGVISAAANNSLGIVGIAPRVQIVALKACWQQDARGDTARCNSLTLAQALAAAIDERAQVVNLSLTGPHDPLLNSLVSAGSERGILYVGAAPADGAADGFPGGAPGVIPVDMSETGKARSGVLRAPGREVVTLVPGGHYDFVSGPSLATAHVSGAVALLLAKDRKLNRSAVYELLSHSAQGAADGAGMPINACRALAGLLPQASCGTPRSAAAME